ncbi:hypothetical protein I6G82_08570 [Lysinibacillus macroides]|uniref:Uncharacterized protein n=1 Tax=Lysinibacillus macroides TaxID=33935 RepID=A0A0M9DIW9_9BACI|nr:hypothetical protein [Lysinibacillus macroides]KOY81543.1 hypothetical protein ADM90_14125 [Lysinibacillus macroides]QPR69622.1 hypothetical protein I6G82_08570 [Lysinibacillus macroides]
MQYFQTNTSIEKFDENILAKFKKLFLDYRYLKLFYQMIDKTRNHEICLLICDNFEKILMSNRSAFTLNEFESIDKKIIKLRLHCLDKTDRWNKYIEYFEYVFNNKNYYSTYSNESDVSRFGKFYIHTRKSEHHIHFLYEGSYRYEVIERKIARSLKTDKLGNLRHHPQSELTDEEINHRYNEVLKWSKILDF